MTDPTRRHLLGAIAMTALLPGVAAAHEGHAMGGAGAAPRLSQAAVALPDLTLTRQDGRQLPLRQALDDGRPVFLDFIFTTCTAVCPVLSQVFAEVRDRLGERRRGVHFVSLSIDPQHDTPRRLREYGERFGADPGWSFFTGTEADMATVQRAFGIFRGDKMNHTPATFVHAPRAAQWTRVDGFASPALLLEQFRALGQAA